MNAPDGLVEALGAEYAEALRTAMKHGDRTINIAPRSGEMDGGYSGARLCTVTIRTGNEGRPQRCVAKLCPPDPDIREPKSHNAAVYGPWKEFAEQHLVKLRYDPVPCPDGWVILLQDVAGGTQHSTQLSKLENRHLGPACRIVRRSLLEEWTGSEFRLEESQTLAHLLRIELRHGDEPGRELHEWAASRGLLEHATIDTGTDGVLPNPLGLLDNSYAKETAQAYLTGRSHGDLHGGNVLFPHQEDGTPDLTAFRLIDLATFDANAPLSRDVATLMVATLIRFVANVPADHPQPSALIDLVVDREESARDGLPPHVSRIVDALVQPENAPFVGDNLRDEWRESLKVSLLAQALLHCTYENVGRYGRWWCLRLAARLACRLLPTNSWPDDSSPLRLDPEICGAVEDSAVDLISVHPVIGDAARGEEPVDYPPFVNRTHECLDLTGALDSDGSRIIVVTGFPGVGKSKLVQKVLDGGKESRVDRWVRKHDASRWVSIDVKALIDDLKLGDTSAMRIRHDETPITRLKAALEGPHDGQVVIVIESAENLLDAGRRIRDQQLDDAFEAIFTLGGGLVKMVLVGQHVPGSSNGNTWPESTRRVDVEQLNPESFLEFVDSLGPRPGGLSSLSREEKLELHGPLRGNPRFAIQLDSAVSLARIRRVGLAQYLSELDHKELPRYLTNQLIQGLPAVQQWCMFALAAFDTPVDADAVVELLQGKHSPELVQLALEVLSEGNVVHQGVGGGYHVVSSEVDDILNNLRAVDKDWKDFLFIASMVLGRRQTLTSEATGIADLGLHIAAVNILLRAEMYAEAHEIIEEMDEVLPWNQSEWLLPQRELVRGKLDDAFAEMQNHNALGDIYISRGRFHEADTAYRRALEYERSCPDYGDRSTIYVNIAALHWERNEIANAAEKYAEAFAMAAEQDEGEIQVIALEGLADCHRRRGRYADAIRQAEEAVTRAQRIEFSRAANVAVKLSRWYDELGQKDKARHWIAIAAQEVADHADDSLRAVCLDGRADLLLDGDDRDLTDAVTTARQAVNLAVAQDDPVIQLQARTTLCFAYLLRGDTANASLEIERAATYRRRGRSLLVLALQALVALEKGLSVKASGLFDTLFEEAAQRRSQDGQDFAAGYFEAVAACGRAGPDKSLESAEQALAAASRADLPPTPGIAGRMAFIVDRISWHDPHPERFQPVRDLLGVPIGPRGR